MITSTGRRRHRTRKISQQYAVMAVLSAVMLCAAAIVAMIVSLAGGRSDDAERSGALVSSDRLELTSLDALGGSDRPIYRHSVIPGGVYTPDELRNVLVRDALAATHYQALNPSTVRAETVKEDRFAYVSYRKDDQIYWTRNKVRLSKGETVLTDGTQEIRARCGNCISETPKLPVAEIEPASAEFDQLVEKSNNPGDPFLSAAIRSALEWSAFGPSGGSGRAGAAGGGSAGGASPTDPGGAALLASGGPGGGGIGPRSLGSRGPSFGGPAGSPGSGGGQPGVFPSSVGGLSTGDPDSAAAAPPSVDGSSAGAPTSPSSVSAPEPASGSTPDSPSEAGASGSPLAAGVPGGPSAPGSSGPGDSMSGGSLPESEFVPPGTRTSIPAGIDPPPGFDPATGVQPSTSELASSTSGPEAEPGQALASLPEPGILFLLGGGAAAVVLRRLRSR